MKKLYFLASLVLCLSLFATTRLSLAQDLQEKTSDDVIASMMRDGWKIKQDGVLQRDRGPHQTESFVFGSAGFTWKLQDLQKQLRNLRQAYLAHPTPELRKAILNHRKEIANTQKIIALTRADEESGKTITDRVDKTSCNISFGYSATASYLTSQQGTTASASANFSSNCSFSGEVYAYSISEATVNGAFTTQTLTDGPRSGSSVTATANTSQIGVPSCDSYAYASMTSSDFSYEKSSYSISASNSSCPVVTPVPTITGPNSILATSGCVNTTWTASATGGTSPYTYQWTWNGANVGTGTTYTRSTCAGSSYNKTTNSLDVTVTDSAGNPGSTSISVVEEKDPPLTLTFSVSPTSSSAAPIQLNNSDCVTVTWTASPSGGTTPRTTTIYVNGTSVGTGNSYSKSYCNSGTNTLQTIPAYATVTDSAGASKTSATVNTYVQNHTVTPLTLSFSVSPTSSSASPIQLNGTGCTTVTWTATSAGGTTPRTTTIYVNGTSVGTGSSYSKSYCNTGTNTLQTIPAYATVTDSAGASQTSATVNTYIQNHTVTPPSITIAASPASSSASPIQLYGEDCVTVTWTTTTSGGTSPYTKTIYVSGVSVGNVATYSRTYCNIGTTTLRTIPAYATVTDSAGNSATSGTVNTYIQHHYYNPGGTGGCLVAAPPDGSKITTNPCP
jgi:hypothetical protein